MRRMIKTVSLLLPISLLILFVAYVAYQKWAIDQLMPDAHGIVWTDDTVIYTVEILSRDSVSETRSYVIRVVDTTGTTIYETEASFDFDMFGGGFVRAVQVDDDPEMEIVAWGAHESSEAFFLDFSHGSVKERPLAEVPANMSKLAMLWHDYNIKKPVETVLYGLLLIVYYVLYVIVWLSLRLMRRKKTVDPGTDPTGTVA